jgi:hypothetical protein
VVGKEWNSQILVNLPVTNVPRYTGSHAKTLGLKHRQLPDMGMSSGPPDGERAVDHWADELLIQHNSLVSERTQHFQPLASFLFNAGNN